MPQGSADTDQSGEKGDDGEKEIKRCGGRWERAGVQRDGRNKRGLGVRGEGDVWGII